MGLGMIYGLEAEPLGNNIIPIEAIAVIKCLDEEGEPMFFIRSTRTLGDMEAVGMLTAAQALQVQEINDRFEDDDDDH